MSFSVSFVARNKPHAQALLADRRHSMPASVLAFLEAAIDNLRAANEYESALVSVKAVGHLCDSANSYQFANVTIEVTRIAIEL